jgi:Na+-transporting methylmalonyl-CoA/oxaloacetate decarboxylase gamma subunit
MLLAEQTSRPLMDFTLRPLLEDHGIPLAVMGILVVFAALALVVAFITLLPRLLGPVSAEQPATALAADEDALPEETLVILAAAVAAVICQPHRIVRVRGLTPEDHGWSLEGRMQHHQSHRIHRDRR